MKEEFWVAVNYVNLRPMWWSVRAQWLLAPGIQLQLCGSCQEELGAFLGGLYLDGGEISWGKFCGTDYTYDVMEFSQ